MKNFFLKMTQLTLIPIQPIINAVTAALRNQNMDCRVKRFYISLPTFSAILCFYRLINAKFPQS